MDHDEHPAVGCVRETPEEMGIEIELSDEALIITQRIFINEGISFVSFTYHKLEWRQFRDQIERNEISGIRMAKSFRGSI